MQAQAQIKTRKPELIGPRKYPKKDLEWSKGVMSLFWGAFQKLDNFSANEIYDVLEDLLLKTFGCEREGWRKEGQDIVKYLLCPGEEEIEIEIRITTKPDGSKAVVVNSYMKGIKQGW